MGRVRLVHLEVQLLALKVHLRALEVQAIQEHQECQVHPRKKIVIHESHETCHSVTLFHQKTHDLIIVESAFYQM